MKISGDQPLCSLSVLISAIRGEKIAPMKSSSAAYRLARSAYAAHGVDTEAAIRHALRIPISLHCWQADDVRGLETPKAGLTGSGR